MFERAAGGGVNSYADDTARKDVAGKAGGAAASELGLYLDLLAHVSRFGEGGYEFFIALEDERTGRHAT
jgi:hypothetical protein